MKPSTYALPPPSTVDPLAVVDGGAAEEGRVDERRAGGVQLGHEHVVLAAAGPVERAGGGREVADRVSPVT